MRTLGGGYTYSLCKFSGTYEYAVFARDLIKARRVGVTLVAGTTLLVAGVECFKVVAVNIVADKNIGEEFHECGFTDASLSN